MPALLILLTAAAHGFTKDPACILTISFSLFQRATAGLDMLEQLDVQLLGDNGLLGNQVLKFIVRSACDPCLGELSSRSLTRHLDHLALVIVGLA
ncbi:MAG: hypothetical protein ACRD0K_25945, partial [Egibacteraceae bacterium]